MTFDGVAVAAVAAADADGDVGGKVIPGSTDADVWKEGAGVPNRSDFVHQQQLQERCIFGTDSRIYTKLALSLSPYLSHKSSTDLL